MAGEHETLFQWSRKKFNTGTIIIREYFHNTRRPFRLTLAGEVFYVLTSPHDVAAVYKETESLTFDQFVRDIMVAFGASPGAIEKMWLLPSNDKHGFNAQVENPSQKCLAQLTRDFHKQQLHPGQNQRSLSEKFQGYIEESLRWDSMSTRPNDKYILRSSEMSKEISLKGWCADVLLNAATRAFYGESLLQNQPDLFRDFFDFDDNSWMLMYRYPRFMATSMYQAKDAAIDALTKYFATPKGSRRGEAWFIRTLEAEQRQLGIDDRDIATLNLMVYWV